jgi:PPOX class probable F420-dependent enzyme
VRAAAVINLDSLDSANPGSATGYAIAFFVPLLDAFLPIVPSETVVVGLGVLASRNFDARIAPLVLLVALGAFTGDNISYWLGRRFGQRIASLILRGERGRTSRAWAERMLDQYGMRLIIVARFIPGGRTAVTLMAGVIDYPWKRFRLAAAIAAVIWTSYAFGIGLIGGRAFENNTLAALGLGFAIAAGAAGLIELIRRLIGRRRSTRVKSMSAVPAGYEDLLSRPLFGDLATVRPDGDPSVTPMWFAWDGELLRFTHTSKRQKTRDIEHNPRIAFVIMDPDRPTRYLQVRGAVESVEADPTGSFYVELSKRYGNENPPPPPDAPDRVVITVRPFAFTKRG